MKPAIEQESGRPRKLLASLSSKLFGLVSLILRSVEGITRLAARVHLQFSHLPWPGDIDVEPGIAHAPFPYPDRPFRLPYAVGFSGTPNRFVASEDPVDDFRVKQAMSILNGVVVDRLEEGTIPERYRLTRNRFRFKKAVGLAPEPASSTSSTNPFPR